MPVKDRQGWDRHWEEITAHGEGAEATMNKVNGWRCRLATQTADTHKQEKDYKYRPI